MLFELLLLSALGILFIALGLIIWRKQKITLVNSISSSKVSKENIPAFTALIGNGMILIGAGMMLTGIVDYAAKAPWGWVFFVITFIPALIVMIYATKKYNR